MKVGASGRAVATWFAGLSDPLRGAPWALIAAVSLTAIAAKNCHDANYISTEVA